MNETRKTVKETIKNERKEKEKGGWKKKPVHVCVCILRGGKGMTWKTQTTLIVMTANTEFQYWPQPTNSRVCPPRWLGSGVST